MRITQVLNKARSRKVPNRRQYDFSYTIPFQELYPLQIGDRYDNRQQVDNARPCISQLTVLLQCFKDSDFNQKRCSESIKAYYSCVEEHMANAAAVVKTRKLHEVRNVRELTQIEATKLLKSKPIT